MPNNAVIRKDKIPTDMRIVFNASSSEPNFPSFNDYLSSSSSLKLILLMLLLQFRLNKVVLTADMRVFENCLGFRRKRRN